MSQKCFLIEDLVLKSCKALFTWDYENVMHYCDDEMTIFLKRFNSIFNRWFDVKTLNSKGPFMDLPILKKNSFCITEVKVSRKTQCGWLGKSKSKVNFHFFREFFDKVDVLTFAKVRGFPFNYYMSMQRWMVRMICEILLLRENKF